MAEEVTFTDFVKAISQSPEDVRLRLAKQLKRAGLYSGTPSGKFNNAMYDALTKAETKRVQLATITGPLDRFNFIDDLAAEGRTGGKKGPSKVTSRTISRPEEYFDEIDAVTREELGRELSTAGKRRLAKKRIELEKAGEFDVTTTYNADGSFRQTTGGGMTPQQFFIEEVSNSDEARANKVLQGYSILLNLFGGLR